MEIRSEVNYALPQNIQLLHSRRILLEMSISFVIASTSSFFAALVTHIMVKMLLWVWKDPADLDTVPKIQPWLRQIMVLGQGGQQSIRPDPYWINLL